MTAPSFFRSIRRTGAAALVLIYSAQSTVLLNASETNFWKQRHSVAVQEKPLEVAALPSDLMAPLRLQGSALITPAISSQRLERLPPSLRGRLSRILSNVASNAGSVGAIKLPDKPKADSPIVLHIQDVHMNTEAQTNISTLIQHLSGSVAFVGVEGDFAPVNLQPYLLFKNAPLICAVADYLLSQNDISGSVHAALQRAVLAKPIVGIDDREHHGKDVIAVQQSAGHRAAANRALQKQLVEISSQASSMPAPLNQFRSRRHDYHEKNTPQGDYISFLKTLSSAPPTPNLRRFSEALAMEKKLDFTRVESERNIALRLLSERLIPAQRDALIASGLQYRAGMIGHLQFYRLLGELAARCNVPFERYPNFSAYLKYVLLADGIDGSALIQEIAALENAAGLAVTNTASQKTFLDDDKFVLLLTKLVDFSLSSSEWTEFKQLAATRAALLPESIFAPFLSFYREAETRDEKMATNMMNEQTQRHATAMALVTGGFHSDGVALRLQQHGFTVVTITPKITHVDDHASAYLSVFSRERTPLEKIFHGEKLFLAQTTFTDRAQALFPILTLAGAEFENGPTQRLPKQDVAVVDALPTTAGMTAEVESETATGVTIKASRRIAGALQSIKYLVTLRPSEHGLRFEDVLESPIKEQRVLIFPVLLAFGGALVSFALNGSMPLIIGGGLFSGLAGVAGMWPMFRNLHSRAIAQAPALFKMTSQQYSTYLFTRFFAFGGVSSFVGVLLLATMSGMGSESLVLPLIVAFTAANVAGIFVHSLNNLIFVPASALSAMSLEQKNAHFTHRPFYWRADQRIDEIENAFKQMQPGYDEKEKWRFRLMVGNLSYFAFHTTDIKKAMHVLRQLARDHKAETIRQVAWALGSVKSLSPEVALELIDLTARSANAHGTGEAIASIIHQMAQMDPLSNNMKFSSDLLRFIQNQGGVSYGLDGSQELAAIYELIQTERITDDPEKWESAQNLLQQLIQRHSYLIPLMLFLKKDRPVDPKLKAFLMSLRSSEAEKSDSTNREQTAFLNLDPDLLPLIEENINWNPNRARDLNVDLLTIYLLNAGPLSVENAKQIVKVIDQEYRVDYNLEKLRNLVLETVPELKETRPTPSSSSSRDQYSLPITLEAQLAAEPENRVNLFKAALASESKSIAPIVRLASNPNSPLQSAAVKALSDVVTMKDIHGDAERRQFETFYHQSNNAASIAAHAREIAAVLPEGFDPLKAAIAAAFPADQALSLNASSERALRNIADQFLQTARNRSSYGGSRQNENEQFLFIAAFGLILAIGSAANFSVEHAREVLLNLRTDFSAGKFDYDEYTQRNLDHLRKPYDWADAEPLNLDQLDSLLYSVREHRHRSNGNDALLVVGITAALASMFKASPEHVEKFEREYVNQLRKTLSQHHAPIVERIATAIDALAYPQDNDIPAELVASVLEFQLNSGKAVSEKLIGNLTNHSRKFRASAASTIRIAAQLEKRWNGSYSYMKPAEAKTLIEFISLLPDLRDPALQPVLSSISRFFQNEPNGQATITAAVLSSLRNEDVSFGFVEFAFELLIGSEQPDGPVASDTIGYVLNKMFQTFKKHADERADLVMNRIVELLDGAPKSAATSGFIASVYPQYNHSQPPLALIEATERYFERNEVISSVDAIAITNWSSYASSWVNAGTGINKTEVDFIGEQARAILGRDAGDEEIRYFSWTLEQAYRADLVNWEPNFNRALVQYKILLNNLAALNDSIAAPQNRYPVDHVAQLLEQKKVFLSEELVQAALRPKYLKYASNILNLDEYLGLVGSQGLAIAEVWNGNDFNFERLWNALETAGVWDSYKPNLQAGTGDGSTLKSVFADGLRLFENAPNRHKVMFNYFGRRRDYTSYQDLDHDSLFDRYGKIARFYGTLENPAADQTDSKERKEFRDSVLMRIGSDITGDGNTDAHARLVDICEQLLGLNTRENSWKEALSGIDTTTYPADMQKRLEEMKGVAFGIVPDKGVMRCLSAWSAFDGLKKLITIVRDDALLKEIAQASTEGGALGAAKAKFYMAIFSHENLQSAQPAAAADEQSRARSSRAPIPIFRVRCIRCSIWAT